MKHLIYPEGKKNDHRQFKAPTPWKAVELWLDTMKADDLQNLLAAELVLCVESDRCIIAFTVGKQCDGGFVVDRTDGKPWHVTKSGSMPNQTFHLGVSCYGPNKDGKFCGTISVESITIHSETYNTLDEARQESLGKLLEYITVTLGFSRTEAIEKLGKECNDRRKNADSDERTSVDG